MADLRRFRASILVTGATLLFGVGACEKLVGIEDTIVTTGQAGASPSAQAGSSGAGPSRAGAHAEGGNDESAGTTSGGKGGSAGTAGSANGGAAAGTGGDTVSCACEPPTPVCEAGQCIARGPTQAVAGSAASKNEFYIDSTEVTYAQYAKFLAAKGDDTSGQRAECGWNTSYQLGGIVDDKRPAVKVDFCDAAAYCDWAGERLCGGLGGGPLLITDLIDPLKSQWYLACAGPSAEDYPYGTDFQAGYCNVSANGSMADAGAFAKCEGHYSGVLDLLGNAAEWIDSCDDLGGDDRSMDKCWLMGGSSLDDKVMCSTHFNALRNDAQALYGFRCCSK